jgi:hypothetical protein
VCKRKLSFGRPSAGDVTGNGQSEFLPNAHLPQAFLIATNITIVPVSDSFVCDHGHKWQVIRITWLFAGSRLPATGIWKNIKDQDTGESGPVEKLGKLRPKRERSKNRDWERGVFPRACTCFLRPPGFFNSPKYKIFESRWG